MRLILLSWFFFITFSTNFFGIPMILVSGQCQSDQQSLLLQMKNSLIFNSTLSVSLVQWNQSTDCCTWNGVECDMAGHVISLDLIDESICGPLPPSIGYLTRLEYLDLSFNSFTGPLPPSMGNLTRLGYLHLSLNSFSGPLPPSMGNLTQLEYLALLSNNFTGPLPPSMGNLTQLEHLALSSNHFTGPLPPSMGYLTQLEHLSLSFNSFTGLLPPSMGLCGPPLTKSCTNSSESTISPPSNQFDPSTPISSNEFDWQFFLVIGVGFGIGFVAAVAPLIFSDRVNLCSLSIVGQVLLFCHGIVSTTTRPNLILIEGLDPKSLSNCTKLEVLDHGNKISDAFPCWLKNVSSLHVLVLRSNIFYGNIGCLEYDVFWPKLQIIDLASNNFIGRLPQKGLTTWKAMMVDEQKVQSQLKHLQYETLATNPLYCQDTVMVTMKDQEVGLVKILTLFTSIDLSSINEQFKSLIVLNLSHNAFTSSISYSHLL
ncbi:hypothetical protein Q3G72_024655 [Acer saccharum]|nr:hypothetical protein Q3G72_024655 [Acer saccharum]